MNLYRVTTPNPVVERAMLDALGVSPGLSVVSPGVVEYVVAEAVNVGPGGTLVLMVDHPDDEDAGIVVRAFASGQWLDVCRMIDENGDPIEVDQRAATLPQDAWLAADTRSES